MALSRHGHRLNRPAPARTQSQSAKPLVPAAFPARFCPPLTLPDSPPILAFPSTQRKEVIQCLLPSAVTSLGSPAKAVEPGNRAFSAPGPASTKIGTRREQSRRVFVLSSFFHAIDHRSAAWRSPESIFAVVVIES